MLKTSETKAVLLELDLDLSFVAMKSTENNILPRRPPPLVSLQQQAGATVSYENIDRTVDYQGWLEVKKIKWKDTLEERKRLSNSKRLRQSDDVSELPGVSCSKNGQGTLSVICSHLL